MAKEKINAPRVSLEHFLNNSPELKAGRVELLGGFGHWMEFEKKMLQETEENFAKYLAEFRQLTF